MNTANKTKATFIAMACVISFLGFGQTKNFKVTLDAGHGGKDIGATYHGHVEKNIALAVVLKVGRILEDYPNVEVNYTRKTDVFIDLVERTNIANKVDANIFVSIHCNANKDTKASGTETYVMGLAKNASSLAVSKSENSVVTMEKDYKQKYAGFDPNSPESMIGITLMQEEYLENSIALASKVEDGFAKLGKKIRGGGVKQAAFLVLHRAYMPRVLIEMGFISNREEGAELDSEDGQEDIAEAIANAIMSYKKEYFGNGSSENVDERPSQKITPSRVKDTSNPVRKEVMVSSETPRQENKSGIVFKVQISASTRKLDLEPRNFKGLKNMSMSRGTTIYKYMYGETSDYEEAKKLLQDAKEKGFNSAFIIAFKDGNSISVEDALK